MKIFDGVRPGDYVLGDEPRFVSAVARHALGTIIRAKDPLLGASEHIYLKGAASTAPGSATAASWTARSTITSTGWRGTTCRGTSTPIA